MCLENDILITLFYLVTKYYLQTLLFQIRFFIYKFYL